MHTNISTSSSAYNTQVSLPDILPQFSSVTLTNTVKLHAVPVRCIRPLPRGAKTSRHEPIIQSSLPPSSSWKIGNRISSAFIPISDGGEQPHSSVSGNFETGFQFSSIENDDDSSSSPTSAFFLLSPCYDEMSDLSIVERRRAEINSRPAINSHSTRAQIMNKDETKSPRKTGPLTRTMRKHKPFLQPRLRKNTLFF
mmetsp:Transcript_4765/g.7227  ORF Transcript_4765/g.7227 Transcript_4765/m.7227 type:complete len:197 (-) Transcript_4765:253-843(-)